MKTSEMKKDILTFRNSMCMFSPQAQLTLSCVCVCLYNRVNMKYNLNIRSSFTFCIKHSSILLLCPCDFTRCLNDLPSRPFRMFLCEVKRFSSILPWFNNVLDSSKLNSSYFSSISLAVTEQWYFHVCVRNEHLMLQMNRINHCINYPIKSSNVVFALLNPNSDCGCIFLWLVSLGRFSLLSGLCLWLFLWVDLHKAWCRFWSCATHTSNLLQFTAALVIFQRSR